MLKNSEREVCYRILTKNETRAQTARMSLVSPNTVKKYERRLRSKKLSWDDVVRMGDSELLAVLKSKRKCDKVKQWPDFKQFYKYLQVKNQTFHDLWKVYREENPGKWYSYSHCKAEFNRYKRKSDPTHTFVHKAGELACTDYAGTRMPWYEPDTGVKHRAYVFVAVLAASNYTFARACATLNTQDFILCLCKAFHFFGGVPQAVKTDNHKAAVIKPGPFPVFNRCYLDCLRHYNSSALTSRPRSPRDNGAAENAVRWITERIIIPLNRDRKFFSISEINKAIEEKLIDYNNEPLSTESGTRSIKYLELEKPALQALPSDEYEQGEWIRRQKVPSNYLVRIHKHRYSVPHELIGEQVEGYVKADTIELWNDGCLVATHKRSDALNEMTVDPKHRTSKHNYVANQNEAFYLAWAKDKSEYIVEAVKYQFAGQSSESPRACKACEQLKRLVGFFGDEISEAACKYAKEFSSLSIASISSILESHRYDSREIKSESFNIPQHGNIRGAEYYSPEGKDDEN